MSCHIFTRLSLLFFFSISCFAIHGQKRKELYAQMDSLINAGQFAKGRPLARQILKEAPENAYTNFLLGNTYKQEALSLYLHESEKQAIAYDSAQQIYERAKGLVDKKELRRSKDYYEKILKTEEFDTTQVKGIIDKEVEGLEGYFGRITLVKVRVRGIQDVYMPNEALFVQLLKQHPNFSEFYLTFTPAKDAVLNELQQQQKASEEAVANYNSLFVGDSAFKALNFQKFAFFPIEDNTAYHVQENDFLRRELRMYDFGQWAKKVQEKAKGYQDARAKLTALEQQISQALQSHQATADSAAWAKEAKSIESQLLPYETPLPWPVLLSYQLEKLAYFREEAKARKILNDGAFFDLTEKGAIISPLIQRLIRLEQSAAALPEGKISFSRYMDILESFLGEFPDMIAFKAKEEAFVSQQQLYWNTNRAASVELPANMPDQVEFKGASILLRASKISLSAGLSKGYYMTEKVHYLEDSSIVAQGRYGKEADCFLARISKEGVALWIKTDLDPLEHTKSIEHLVAFQKAGIMYLSKRKKEGVERVVMEVLDIAAGLPTSTRVLRAMPEQVFMAPDAPGVFFVHVKEQAAGGFKEVEIEGYKFGQDKGVFLRFMLRGYIVSILPQGKKLRVVANFHEYQDLDGNFAESKAFKLKGFNVVVATVPLDGKPGTLTPVLSMTPLLAQEASSEADGKVWINGLQGEYIFISQKEVSGGKPWQKYVD